MSEKVKVVAIDDDPEVCLLIKAMLEGQGDFEVTVSSDPKQAESVIRQVIPAIILLDIVMPERRGQEIIASLKKIEELKKIPIVVVSGKGEMVFDKKNKKFKWLPNNPLAIKERPNIPPVRGAESFAESYGADDYVSKPISPEVLIQVIQDVLSRRSSRGGADKEGFADLLE